MRTKSGFTLVEIMIVIAIVALLAAVAIPNLLRARMQANEATAQANLKSIATSLENYAAIHAEYPTNTATLLGASPPYLSIDYFAGAHGGYTFTSVLATTAYTITANPVSASMGTSTFLISTGGNLTAH